MQAADGLRGGPDAGLDLAVMVPRINIEAFCETQQLADAIRTAAADRRMARAHTQLHMGGIAAAVRHFEAQSTPNLLIVEAPSEQSALMTALAALAEVCQAETKVIVAGRFNDVSLYRELIRQGISEYLVMPVSQLQVVETAARLFTDAKTAPVGRAIAFMAAKGGAGSSTIAQNCALEISRYSDLETAIVDFDLAYGSAGLNFDIDTAAGLLEAIDQPARIDPVLLDRLFIKIDGKLSLLSGPGGVSRDASIATDAVEAIMLALRAGVPRIVLDLPLVWSSWVKSALLNADRVVIIAEPELASLRNAKLILDMLKTARPNDLSPLLVLNQVGLAKRPEISPADFAKAAGVELSAVIPHDAQAFGAALNNGKMLLDMVPKSKAAEPLRQLARQLAGTDKAARRSGSFFKRFRVFRKT
jgi:pilus assembly protein CpaE